MLQLKVDKNKAMGYILHWHPRVLNTGKKVLSGQIFINAGKQKYSSSHLEGRVGTDNTEACERWPGEWSGRCNYTNRYQKLIISLNA